MSAEVPKPAPEPSVPISGSSAGAWSEVERAAHRRQLGTTVDGSAPEAASGEVGLERSGAFEGEIGGTQSDPNSARVEVRKGQVLKRVGLIGFLGVWIFFNFYRFDYVVILPGGTDVVNERISIKPSVGSINPPITAASSVNPPTYPAEGKLLWATVGVKNDVRGLDLLMGWLKGDSDVFKRELLYGKANRKEAAQQSREEMDDAKSVAKVLAARRLGIATVEGGAEVLDREKGRPVEKLLADGEVIIAADGKPICLSGDLRELMLTKKKGDSVTLTVLAAQTKAADKKAGTAKPQTERPET
jgi:PDZ domain-containing secreted protein